jgi:indole-3-glycerol phosphate synthase
MFKPSMNVLASILEDTRREVKLRRSRISRAMLAAAPSYVRPVVSLEAALRRSGLRVIAEIKKASPSRGVIREDFEPVTIATQYALEGAAAISVLTEEKHFQGSLAYLSSVRACVELPIVRKDFIIDEYQIHEARSAGADAVLLIVAALGGARLAAFMAEAAAVGLECLVEVHSEEELCIANEAGARIIGINNRDLATFVTDIGVSVRLAPHVRPEAVTVSESGIHSSEDIARLRAVGIRSVLIGESFMRSVDPGAALRAMLELGGTPA